MNPSLRNQERFAFYNNRGHTYPCIFPTCFMERLYDCAYAYTRKLRDRALRLHAQLILREYTGSPDRKRRASLLLMLKRFISTVAQCASQTWNYDSLLNREHWKKKTKIPFVASRKWNNLRKISSNVTFHRGNSQRWVLGQPVNYAKMYA